MANRQNTVYGISMPTKLKLAVLPIYIGVGMAIVSDFSFNAVGAFWAVAGLVATAFYQVLIKTRQDKLEANSFQLLHYQAPQSALLVAICTPLFDKVTGPIGFLQVSKGQSLENEATSFSRKMPRWITS